jgi:MFS family permease
MHTVHRWRLQIVVAALAMIMTIPGRTQGLGLITESILNDEVLRLDRTQFAWLNLLATLTGALAAIPAGWLMDRLGTRPVLLGLLVMLGAGTYFFASVSSTISFFIGLFLMRSLGQSALSAASLTHMGKWFPQRVSLAMAAFGIVSTIGFMGLFSGLDPLIKAAGWRETWSYLGVACWGLALLFVWICDRPPSSDSTPVTPALNTATKQYTWLEALATPTFWLFALTSALFNWVSSGIGLFNEDVLAESGFSRELYIGAISTATIVTLFSNALGGWLSTRWSLAKLMAVGMLMLAGCLGSLPFLQNAWQVYANAMMLGVSAGLVIVAFFACWGSEFGTLHLGKIQGSAQALTVLASALGPVSLAMSKEHFGSYRPLFLVLAALSLVCALLCWVKRN